MSTPNRPVLKPLIAAIRTSAWPLLRWSSLALLPGVAVAGPLGEQVVKGNVNVTRPDATTTRIAQGSERAVVNWNSFSVGGNEYVHFVQPGTTSSILNRVVGGQESQILGRIDANGRVFLVNPQGVYFGAGAKVETAGFAASTLDINDDDFMAGRYVFSRQAGAPNGTVSNSGEIKASQFVMLLGDRVANEGLIDARLGTVALAAGSKISLQLDDSGLVNFAVDLKTFEQQAGVENTGAILADGGRVLMTAKVAEGLVATVVNNAGLVQAKGIDEQEGSIVLRGNGGSVINSGTLDASGPQGGAVLVTSNHDVVLEAGAQALAEGQQSGKGGSVRLIANGSLQVAGGSTVAARGGASGGQGGFVEVSAHQGGMQVASDAVQLGQGGQLLIDPSRLKIYAASYGGISSSGSAVRVASGYLESQLNAGNDVLLVAADRIEAEAAVTAINAPGFSPGLRVGDLTLKTGTVAASYGSSLGAGAFIGSTPPTVTRSADGVIDLSHVDINVGGNFIGSAGSVTGEIKIKSVAAVGSLELHAGGDIEIDGGLSVRNTLSGSSANVLAEASRIRILGGVTAKANSVSYGTAAVTLSAAEGISVAGPILATGGSGAGASSESATGTAFVDIANGTDSALGSEASGTIDFGGGIDATAGSLVAVNVANAAGRISLRGASQLNQTGTDAGTPFSTTQQGAFLQMSGRDGVSTAGPVAVRGLDVAVRLAGNYEASGGSSPDGSGGVGGPIRPTANPTGPVNINSQLNLVPTGAPRADQIRALSLFGTDLIVAAPINAAQIDTIHGGGALMTEGEGILNADELRIGVFGSSKGVNLSTNTAALVFGIDTTGGATVAPVNVAINNSARTGATRVSTDPGSVDSGTEFSVLPLAEAAFRFSGDATFLNDLTAQSLAVNTSGGNVLFAAGVTVGDRPLPDQAGDANAINSLAAAASAAGVTLPLPMYKGARTNAPNAFFAASGDIKFAEGLSFDDPDVPYVVFTTDGLLDFGPGVKSINPARKDFLAQFTAYTASKTVHIENSLPVALDASGPYFTNDLHFKKLPGTTLLFGGTGTTGSIVVGANGPLDVGNQNAFFVSTGAVTGAGNLVSAGFAPQSTLPPITPPITPSEQVQVSMGTVGSAIQDDVIVSNKSMLPTERDDEKDNEKDDEGKTLDLAENTSGRKSSLVSSKSNTGQMCE